MSSREWRNIYHTVLGTVISLGILSAGSIVFSTVVGHASSDDLARVEKESKERDGALRDDARDHRRDAEKEWRTQAQFRGAVQQAMGIDPPNGVSQ